MKLNESIEVSVRTPKEFTVFEEWLDTLCEIENKFNMLAYFASHGLGDDLDRSMHDLFDHLQICRHRVLSRLSDKGCKNEIK